MPHARPQGPHVREELVDAVEALRDLAQAPDDGTAPAAEALGPNRDGRLGGNGQVTG